MVEIEAMVRVTGLTKRYGKLPALDDVTFTLGSGEIVALLGPNGAGKTTAFKCMLGVTGFQGTVEVNGVSVRKDGKTVRGQIGYLPQVPAFDDGDTCEQVLDFLTELRGGDPKRVAALLERVRLTEQRHVPVGQLSGGMRQRLALAAALLSDPPLLLLDEPTANLDVESRGQFHELLKLLRDEGHTIVLSTHFVDTIGEIADRVIVLKQGRLALNATLGELHAMKQGRRFIVNVNGTEPGVLLAALQNIGIGADRVSQVESQFQEMLMAAIGADTQEGKAEG